MQHCSAQMSNRSAGLIRTRVAGLSGARQRDPQIGSYDYNGNYTTFWAEAEFLPDSGGVAGGSFRVQLNNTSLRTTRKMAIGVTMQSRSRDGNALHYVNTYYKSLKACDLAGDRRACSRYPFTPYAVVCFTT
jgi:hypothetical protein